MALLRWERRVTTTQSELNTHDESERAGRSLVGSLKNLRPERRVELLGVVLTAVAGSILLTLPDVTESTRPSPAWVIAVLFLAFAAIEINVFKFRRPATERIRLGVEALCFLLHCTSYCLKKLCGT